MNVVVVGGGPAGIMSAISSKENGNNVILIEKNSSLGKKLIITGKGRCNITSSLDIEEFIKNIPGIEDAGSGIRTRGLTVSQELVRALLNYPMSRAL